MTALTEAQLAALLQEWSDAEEREDSMYAPLWPEECRGLAAWLLPRLGTSAVPDDGRESLAQEIRETLRVRGHWAPPNAADLISAVGKALDTGAAPPSPAAIDAVENVLTFDAEEGGDPVTRLRRAIAAAYTIDGVRPVAPQAPDGVTRFELIDHRTAVAEPGRFFVAYDCRVALSYQDDGRTLKVFVTDRLAALAPGGTP